LRSSAELRVMSISKCFFWQFVNEKEYAHHLVVLVTKWKHFKLGWEGFFL